MGWWTDVKPTNLGRRAKKHPWVFAQYNEVPSERKDSNWYMVFLFRDEQRERFGKFEHCGKTIATWDVRKMAAKVVLDKSFRASLLSDDSSLPEMWKRR
jgi:hypothetical protein